MSDRLIDDRITWCQEQIIKAQNAVEFHEYRVKSSRERIEYLKKQIERLTAATKQEVT